MVRRALLPIAGLLACLGLAGAASGEPPAARADGGEPRRDRALRAFDRFAASWMERMERAESENREEPRVYSRDGRTYVTYRGYAEGFEIELRDTGSAQAPFVGLIRYHEVLFACADRSAERCRATSRTPVTEIFRFQDGRWVY